MKSILILTVIITFVTLGYVEAQAALNLSVAPVSGGNSLRFGRIVGDEEASQEVRIRITSTDTEQYQIYQRMIDPFTNDRGVTFSRDILMGYTLLGSNASGTLYAQALEPIGPADQLLYSSSPNGDSDSFTVAYMVRGNAVTDSGNFLGRLQYTARPVGGAGQDDVILNVTFEVSDDLKVEIKGSSTANTVRLRLNGDQESAGHVQLSFRENPGRTIRFVQDVQGLPQNASMNEIPSGMILFATSGSASGEMYPGTPTPLSRRAEEIYSSQAAEDTFYVHFFLDETILERQETGVYAGRLNYAVEAGTIQEQTVIDLELTVDPVFALSVDLPPDGLSFERILPDSQPELRDVNVAVRSNLGKPYMVTQSVISPLTNASGDQIPAEYFTVKVVLLEGESGKSGFGDFQPVPIEDHPVFSSDASGTPSRFKVVYRLRPFKEMAPGSYATAVRFSLGEI
ncbi:MAG TPA: hypothetical protein PKV41_01345 [Candidatus Omnitrophota bacterium]|nr:hypothetical protein [Candidatus Omnitrophota bacterium]